AEEWDNTGLLIGDRTRPVKAVITALTVTPKVVGEAARRGVDLIVSHHPFPFRAAKRWTNETAAGALLLALAGKGLALYSPHTSFDSALWGINRQIAARLELTDVVPMRPLPVFSTGAMLCGLESDIADLLKAEVSAALGSGRIGTLPRPLPLSELLGKVRQMFSVQTLPYVGRGGKEISRIAIACGAADDFVEDAINLKADAILLGEIRYHHALEAEQADLAVLAPGHFATEHFATVALADRLARRFPQLNILASQEERDPFRFDGWRSFP
ncbi:MAG: Nif3-like dinuclear metal center hexameric protein, partial [Thermoguttaceae bacterium]|nr:Nif3-like dinuclear metal center hexameric protein [Thermoguttaceae bacterium]